jgi:hypothetical protein
MDCVGQTWNPRPQDCGMTVDNDLSHAAFCHLAASMSGARSGRVRVGNSGWFGRIGQHRPISADFSLVSTDPA